MGGWWFMMVKNELMINWLLKIVNYGYWWVNDGVMIEMKLPMIHACQLKHNCDGCWWLGNVQWWLMVGNTRIVMNNDGQWLRMVDNGQSWLMIWWLIVTIMIIRLASRPRSWIWIVTITLINRYGLWPEIVADNGREIVNDFSSRLIMDSHGYWLITCWIFRTRCLYNCLIVQLITRPSFGAQ